MATLGARVLVLLYLTANLYYPLLSRGGGGDLELYLLGVPASLLAAPLRDPLDPTTQLQTPV